MMSPNVTRLVLTPVAACAARCRRMLGALGRLGKRRAAAIAPSAGAAAVMASASAFTRVARAMRLIALLELRVRALLARGPVTAAPAPAAPAPAETERLQDPEERDPVERPERLEDRESPDRERFPAFDIDKLIFEDARPLTEIVAAICRDLGLGEAATRRAQAPLAELEALMRGETPPPKPARRSSSMDREPSLSSEASAKEEGSPLLEKGARVDARGPKKPP